MSTAKTTPGKAYASLAAKEFNPESVQKGRVPDVERLDISALQLDESFGADCDPYNSTGQHLVAAIKRKYED